MRNLNSDMSYIYIQFNSLCHPDPEIRGKGGSLRASFWSKNMGGGGLPPGAPPLDPPLVIQVRMQEFKFGGVQNCGGLKVIL